MSEPLTELEKQLIQHEGFKLRVYKDTLGIETIGVGRNLRDKGICDSEVIYLLRNDIAECRQSLEKFDWYNQLIERRKRVLIDMCFNMGMRRLLGFTKMIAALKESNYAKAADEMLNSKWADQVKSRAINLYKMMVPNEQDLYSN
jgi:lysozyme